MLPNGVQTEHPKGRQTASRNSPAGFQKTSRRLVESSHLLIRRHPSRGALRAEAIRIFPAVLSCPVRFDSTALCVERAGRGFHGVTDCGLHGDATPSPSHGRGRLCLPLLGELGVLLVPRPSRVGVVPPLALARTVEDEGQVRDGHDDEVDAENNLPLG